jgi:hypothetical protein
MPNTQPTELDVPDEVVVEPAVDFTALMIAAKLSSASTIAAACLATLGPGVPIAIPMSPASRARC